MTDLGRGPVALDTGVFIYFIEEHPRFLPLVEVVFAAVDNGHWEAVTSALDIARDTRRTLPYRQRLAG